MLNTHAIVAAHFPTVANNQLLRKPVTLALQHLFYETELNQFSHKYPYLSSFDFVEQFLAHFAFSYRVNDQQRERIPESGKVVIVANHPIGMLDGLALIKCIKEVRSDIKVIANDMLMNVEALRELLLPINNMQGGTKKQNIQEIHEHLRNEGALIVFPAGEVSRLRPQGVRDQKWNSGFLRFAKANLCPILPVHLNAKNSALFYGVSMLYKPAASALLVREMFNKKNQNIDITIGELIPLNAFDKLPFKLNDQAKIFKKHVYLLAKNKKGILSTQAPIASPEERRDLLKALKNECEVLGQTPDNKTIYLYRYTQSSPIMRELGRLREKTFRAVGEGTNQRRDIDVFDKSYFHLILWDTDDLEIAGAYRFGDVKALMASGLPIYSSTLFDYQASMQPYFAQGLELGRSFVQEKYWGKRSLDYLWLGLGAFLSKHPEYRYLFGPVTLSAQLPSLAIELITAFYMHFFPDNDKLANAKMAYISQTTVFKSFHTSEYKQGLLILKEKLKHMNVSLPTLYKQYAEVTEQGGTRFCGFNIDPDFQNCIDGLVMVDLMQLRPKKRLRYMQ